MLDSNFYVNSRNSKNLLAKILIANDQTYFSKITKNNTLDHNIYKNVTAKSTLKQIPPQSI